MSVCVCIVACEIVSLLARTDGTSFVALVCVCFFFFVRFVGRVRDGINTFGGEYTCNFIFNFFFVIHHVLLKYATKYSENPQLSIQFPTSNYSSNSILERIPM